MAFHAPATHAGWLARVFPILQWLPRYERSWLSRDAIASVSIWALLVPQSLAYSSIAGVPVQYGLYTAFAALLGYALFGTSKQMAQGPSAAVAAVVGAIISPLVGAAALGTDDAAKFAAALALATGIVYLALGAARMGWVSNFLSKAVMGGFVLGFSIGIIIEQSYKLLGVPKVDGSYMEQLWGTIKNLPDTSLTTLALGTACLATLLLMRYRFPRLPRALIVVVLSILAVKLFDLTAHGLAVTGPVPDGLFSVGLPDVGWEYADSLLLGALAVIFVGYSESLASARAMATKHDYAIDPNQELIAQGAACAAAGVVGGYATDGSLSKTSVADAAGQRTQMASILNAALVLLTMLFFASLFEDLPAAALGAIVIDAMIGLISFGDMRRYWRVSRADFVFFASAMAGILFVDIIHGIIIGVVLSLLMLIARASKPPIRRLARNPRRLVRRHRSARSPRRRLQSPHTPARWTPLLRRRTAVQGVGLRHDQQGIRAPRSDRPRCRLHLADRHGRRRCLDRPRHGAPRQEKPQARCRACATAGMAALGAGRDRNRGVRRTELRHCSRGGRRLASLRIRAIRCDP